VFSSSLKSDERSRHYVSYAADDAHRPQPRGFAAAAHTAAATSAAPGTDGRTLCRFNTLTAKFHYTGPTGPDRTRADFVWSGPVGPV